MMSVSNMQMLLTTIGGKDYFVGYLMVSKHSPDDGVDNLIGWVTLYDANQSSGNTGYAAANFKPYQAEGGADPDTFAEALGDGPIYADLYYLRFYILNSNPETYNWWIVLKGANSCDGKPSSMCQSTTRLEGIICNEEEFCVSVAIPVPDRLNIINVNNYIPPPLYPSGYPKKGFGYLDLVEKGLFCGTSCFQFENDNFTAFMWSYQRQQRLLKIPYPVDPKKLDKFDIKYGIITDNELWSVIDPADRQMRLLY